MRTAEVDVSESVSPEARGRPRTVVVGLDGSACAGRALMRAASLIHPDGLLVLVAVEAEMHSPGLLAAPLLDARDGDAARLLAHAREQVTPDCVAFLTVMRRGSSPMRRATSWSSDERGCRAAVRTDPRGKRLPARLMSAPLRRPRSRTRPTR